ncbi:MAG: hypothetical protein QOI69_3751 [Pseudonocardiales bacterium]|nr:hypothetical protein [Pseudonocardiales bacterium]
MTVDAPQTSRADAFREQIAEMKIPAPNAGRDRVLARLVLLLALAGIALGVVGYFMSNGTDSTLTQNDAVVLAVLGISCAVTGSGVFLRYSLAQFLRLWLVRLIHEQRQQ